MTSPGDVPSTRSVAGWEGLLVEGIALAQRQAMLLLEVAGQPEEGPQRLDRPFLLVEHPFGRFEKWLGESVLVAYLAATTPTVDAGLRRQALEVAAQLAPLVAHRAYRRVWLRLPYSSQTSVGAAQALLHDLGVGDPEATEDLRAAAAMTDSDWTERAPRHVLERAWFLAHLDSGQASSAEPSWPQTFPHPIYLLRSDVYALTHDVWFGTGFGGHALLRTSSVGDVLEACAAWLALIGDVDCLGEVIASLFMLGRAPLDGLDTAYRYWLSAHASLVAGRQDGSPHRHLPFLSRRRPSMTPVHDYHPVYVATVAALARGRSGALRQATVPAADWELHATLLPLAEQQLRVYNSLPTLPRRALLARLPPGALLDGLLTAAARQFRLDWIDQLLRVHTSFGEPATWTTREVEAFAYRHAVGARPAVPAR